ncbi:hypothetical protein BD626DRAFT_157366 [Schizophyllum amplum]|uniref:Yeast cell wall synthesis Kre9/Knh1-like N-terminal domain-containing protein n=1 Tax=Schizophyllum amplum TaxID=97359 RepID=A0A550C362_9AGAR|nr:hypothetical protein BD626DRAFT_157366 [Auriculariopsis ampla]
MQFALFTSVVLSALAAVRAAPVDAIGGNSLIVWSPKITSPTADTVWTAGQQYNVTWETNDAPETISNEASVMLGHKEALMSDQVLADGFDLRAGYVTVTAPDVKTGKYFVDLFGDSGNWSPDFKIDNADKPAGIFDWLTGRE